MVIKVKKMIPQQFINVGVHFPKSLAANVRYGVPSRKIKIIGITGTDGKTTTVNMIYKILIDSGKKASMISTINAVIGGKSYDTGFHVTTPSPFMIQRFINQAVKAGDEYLVLEVTSHSLDQFRVMGIKFEIGVITNITHEHLDYHKNFTNYLNSKAKLIASSRNAVLNKDDKNYSELVRKTRAKIVSFGMSTDADINMQSFPISLKIPGKYNILNGLAAAAATNILGIDKKDIRKSLNNFNNLIGRMEEIKNNREIKIIVDFAHTPNALENALITLRQKNEGRIISVFGCASERDIDKRPLMGRISGKLADITILTDEDPRFEDSMKIIDQIAKGATQSGAKLDKNLFKIPDRKTAILEALKMAKPGDIVGIFGKGHERSMNIKGHETEWSDQKAVAEILQIL